jgi:hypothetical protein
MTVSLREEMLEIPTVFVDSEDPDPPFAPGRSWRVYPYTMLDDIGGHRETRAWRVVVLENRYLETIVLPELGGHVYAVRDKSAGCDLFYRNRVIKPGLVALRGAWQAGGIEFNFPQGHSVSTSSRVTCRIVRPKDSAPFCDVGAFNRIWRTWWSVRIMLDPDAAVLKTRVRLANPTSDRRRFYYWSNAAVRAPEELEIIYPAKKAASTDPLHVLRNE